jgi:hypothetical protein
MSILKRQRELKKAEKARLKRAKRHGGGEETSVEPQPTVRLSELGMKKDDDEDDKSDQ